MDDDRLRELLDSAASGPSTRNVDDALAHVQRRRVDRRTRRRAGGALVVAFCLIGLAAYNAEQNSVRESLRFAGIPTSSTTAESTTTTEESTTTTEPDAGVGGELPTSTTEVPAVLGPDALWIRALGGSTYAINPDGSALTSLPLRLPADAMNTTRSPDRRQIAYVVDVTVWIADADGGNARQLSEGVAPRWSPDGRTLAVGCRGGGEFFTNVCIVDAESGLATVVAQGASLPSWSPDGTRLAVVAQEVVGEYAIDRIDVIDLRDSSRTRVQLSAEREPQIIDEALEWSPDGSRLLYHAPDFDNPTPAGTPRHLFIVDTDGANWQQLTFGAVWDDSPAWSPDGSEIAFVRQVEDPGGGGVAILTMATGEVRLVPSTNDFPPPGEATGNHPATQVDW